MATKNLVPRNSGEGSLGSSSKPWASGYYDKLYITGAAGWTQITGAAGGGGGSLWTQVGADIEYAGGDVLPSVTETQNLGSASKRWATGYFAGATLMLGDTALKIADGALVVEGPGGATANVSGATGRLEDLYVNGTRITGGGAGSSLWSQNGNKIYYNTDNVGIGTSNPGNKLDVVDADASNQVIAYFSGANTTSSLVGVEGHDGQIIYLHAGYGNTKGGGLWVPTNRSIVLQTQDGGFVAGATGSTFMIHNDGASSVNHIVADRPGLAIFGDTDGAKANIDLVSTGLAAADNTINFIEGSSLGGTNNRWTVGQDISTDKSNLVLGYKTGDGALDLVTDAKMTLTPTGIGIGTSVPDYPFELQCSDATEQILGKFSGSNTSSALLELSNTDGQVFLQAGYGNTKGGGLYTQSDRSITFTVGTNLVAACTGTTFMIGNDGSSPASEHVVANRPGLVIFGDSESTNANIDLISSGGFSAAANTLNFIEGAAIGQDYVHRWTVGQDIGSSTSNLVMAYKTGDGPTDLVTDAVLTLTPTGMELGSGESWVTAEVVGGDREFRVSGELYITGSAGNWMQITGGGGSSLWTQVGADIKYTAGEVGIGMAPAVGNLEITGAGKDGITIHANANASNFDIHLKDKDDLKGNTIMWSRTGAYNYYMGTTNAADRLFYFLYDAKELDDILSYRASNNTLLVGSNQLFSATTGEFDVLTVNGVPVTGGGGGGGTGLWSANGNKIYYDLGEVGIGTTTPSNKLDVVDTDASNQVIAYFSGANTTSSLVGVEGHDGQIIYLHAGYGNTKGGGLWVPTNRSIVLQTQDGGFVAGATGSTFMIHNDGASSVNHIVADRPGLAIFGDTDGAKANIDLVSTGLAAADNTINFIEGSSLGGTNNRWTVGQDISTDKSNLVLGYKTGDGALDLVTDAKMTLTPTGIGIGTSVPDYPFELQCSDATEQILGKFSGSNTSSALLELSNTDGQVFLQAGYGNTKGGGLYTQSDRSITFTVGTNLVAACTGTTFMIGNDGSSPASEHVVANRPGLVIFGDSESTNANIDLISSGGFSAAANTLNFIEGAAIGQDYVHRWTVGQDIGSSTSNLVMAYKTGDGPTDLVTDAVLTLTPTGMELGSGESVLSVTDNVGIGTSNPGNKLDVVDTDASNQVIAYFSGANTTSSLVGVEGHDGQIIYLHAGYGNTKGGGLWVPTNRSIVLQTQDGGFVAGATGSTFMIHNDGASSVNHIVADRPGLAIFGDTDGAKANIDLVSTGLAAADNTINFIEGSSLGGTNNRWTVGQDISTDKSNLVLGYKTGDGALDLVTDAKMTLTPTGIGIGTSVPDYPFELQCSDATEQILGKFSGSNTSSALLELSNTDGQVFLQAGYGNTKGGGLYTQSDRSITFTVGTNLVAACTGTTFMIGNDGSSPASEHVVANRPGLVIFGDSESTNANIDLISSGGFSAAANTLNFIEGAAIGQDYVHRWTVGQDIGSSTSNLVMAYKTGDGPTDLVTDAKLTLDDSGNAHFEGDVIIGGDSQDNATLTIQHTGTIGHAPALSDYKNAALLITGHTAAPGILGLDQNQMMYSSGEFNISAGSVGGDVGGTVVLSSTPPGKAPSAADKTLKVFNSGVGIASNATTDAQFAANANFPAYPLHVSGGAGVVARIEGDTHVEGELTATTKTFLIDHPSQPGKILRHGCLEGPEHGVYSRGTLVNNNIIALPDYWVDLVDESTITCQLTAYGSSQQLYIESIGSNQIKVGSDQAEVYCHYLAQAERKDVSQIIVEETKG